MVLVLFFFLEFSQSLFQFLDLLHEFADTAQGGFLFQPIPVRSSREAGVEGVGRNIRRNTAASSKDAVIADFDVTDTADLTGKRHIITSRDAA